jgi:hypothetical protein
MINYTRLFITFLLAVIVLQANSQSTATSSSPYSQFGLGNINDQLLPQNIGMGGIGVATNTISHYNSINILNPASYGAIRFTVIDAGVSSDLITLKNGVSPNEQDVNNSISHVAFAFPVTKHSALSFGLLPYSELGYNYNRTYKTSTPVSAADTNVMNYNYSGAGDLNKAYIGYGFAIGKHLLIGANASYIFGNLKQYQTTEIPPLYGTIDSKVEQSNYIRGFDFDYGVQYSIDLSDNKHLTLGYSGSSNSQLNTTETYIVSQYTRDVNNNVSVPLDSLVNNKNSNGKVQLPLINRFGLTFVRDGKYLIGADYTMGKWSDLSIAGVNSGLQDSRKLNIGGQITPNENALSNFFALMDYRMGFIFEQTYLNAKTVFGSAYTGPNTDIKRYAVTFGLGIPLPHDRASSAFYKINFSTEVGKLGTTDNGLIQENYINFHLAFTLNDRWFQRFKFE